MEDDDDDDFPPDEVRSPQEIARRALALFGVWGIATSAPRDDVLEWLEDSDLREALSPDELKFVDNLHPSEKLKINFSWHCERLIVLLWALKLIDRLPDADEQCDTSVFDCLPPFSDQSVEQFISNATTRSEDELWEEADRTLDLHWQARDARLNNRKPKDPVDLEVVQERHHAINWVIGYEGLDWDEVTADT
jgi:hypothetical protein